MGHQSEPQLQLRLEDIGKSEYEMNDVDVTLEQDAFSVEDNVYEITHDFNNFLTNPNKYNK